jgi:hypothetical protein
MNNPFGIPDEVFAAVIGAAVNQQTKNRNPESPFDKVKSDPASLAKRAATMAKASYDAYIEAGFTAEQAFELVKGIYTARR